MGLVTRTPTNFRYGACQVTFNAVDLGSFKDAAVFRHDITYYEITSAQSSMLQGHKILTERALAMIAMQESELAMLANICPSGTYVLDSGGVKKKLQFGGDQIVTGDYKQLIITPTTDGSGTLSTNNNEKVTIFKCLAQVRLEWKFALSNGEILTPVEFHAIEDTTKDTGNRLFLLGDSTATA